MSKYVRPGGQGWIRVPDELAARVRRYQAAHGYRKACVLLGISQVTLDEARESGKLRPDTVARIGAKLVELGA